MSYIFNKFVSQYTLVKVKVKVNVWLLMEISQLRSVTCSTVYIIIVCDSVILSQIVYVLHIVGIPDSKWMKQLDCRRCGYMILFLNLFFSSGDGE